MNPRRLTLEYQHHSITWSSWSACRLTPVLPFDLKSPVNCVSNQSGQETETPRCGSRTGPTNSLKSHSRWAAKPPQSLVLAYTPLIWPHSCFHLVCRKQGRTRHPSHTCSACHTPTLSSRLGFEIFLRAGMINKDRTEQENSLVVQTWCKMKVSLSPAPSKAPQGRKSLC